MFAEVFLTCMAWAVYFEARGESPEAQVAVAEVVKRRADRSNDTSCHVVFDGWQFEWTKRLSAPVVRNATAWKSALEASDTALSGKTDESRGATHFHDTSIKKPRRWRNLCETRQIGRLVFYKPCEVLQ